MKKRYVVAIIILIAMIALTIFGLTKGKKIKQKENTRHQDTVQAHELLPEVDAYYGTEKIVAILGYKTPMDSGYLRDYIIPVSSNRVIPIRVVNNRRNITEIRYEVRSMDDARLIDDGEAKLGEKTKKSTQYEITASAILEARQEYQLVVVMSTDNDEKIYYYARIMVMQDEFVTQQIEFAKNFSKETLGEDTELNIATYLEPNQDLKNDNLGVSTLSSSYKILQWSEMKPTLEGDITVGTKEFCIKDNGESGTYVLDYQIKINNAENVEEKYNVSETIVVWTFAGKNYVLDYQREVNQIWEMTENNVGNAFIDLGIQSQETIHVVESEDRKYIAYEINGDVYSMDLENKEITNLFTLGAQSKTDQKLTKSKVIGIDKNGDANFLVYGYSVSNEHIGENGVSVFHYTKKNNESKEMLFIPFSQPAEAIEQQIHQLCYVNDGTIYFMMDQSLYYVNIGTKERGTVVENMPEGSYAINQSGTAIAYNTNLETKNSDSITVIELTTGKEHEITAENGEKLSVCGYTGDNLIYGLTLPQNVSDQLCMSTLKIVDSSYQEITSYAPDKIVITAVEITDTIINMKRQKKGKEVADDQLIDNTQKRETATKSSYFADGLKLKELAISFNSPLRASIELKKNIASVIFDKSVKVNTMIEPIGANQYYMYAGGKLKGIYYNQNDAQIAAKEERGLVTNRNGQKIWTFEENYE